MLSCDLNIHGNWAIALCSFAGSQSTLPSLTYVFQGTRPFIICGLLVCGSGYFLVGPADFIASPSVTCYFLPLSHVAIGYRRLWLTIVSFALIGFGAALTFVPAFADMLNIAKLVA